MKNIIKHIHDSIKYDLNAATKNYSHTVTKQRNKCRGVKNQKQRGTETTHLNTHTYAHTHEVGNVK